MTDSFQKKRFLTQLNLAAVKKKDGGLTTEELDELRRNFLESLRTRLRPEKFLEVQAEIHNVQVSDADLRSCSTCGQIRDVRDYYLRSDGGQFLEMCKPCRVQKHLKNKNFGRYFFTNSLSSAKKRAAAKGLPFDIDVEYLNQIFPRDKKCPVFGVVMEPGVRGNFDLSPSLDKIIPEKGYVKGNLWYISMRANRIKSDHSISDLLTTAHAIQRKLKECGIDTPDGSLQPETSPRPPVK